MRRGRRGGHSPIEFGGSGEDSFVAVVVTKLTGALLFILILVMVIMVLLPKGVESPPTARADESDRGLEITTPTSLPDGVAGRPYALALAARGGVDPEWALDGPLPEGLSFDPAAAVVSGTPTSGTKEAARLVARVREGSSRDARPLTLAILQPEAPLALPTAWSETLPRLPWRAWLEQGFGFLVLLLVHLIGMNAVRGLERRAWAAGGEGAVGGRYRVMRWLMRLATLGAAGGLATWLGLGR